MKADVHDIAAHYTDYMKLAVGFMHGKSFLACLWDVRATHRGNLLSRFDWRPILP